MADETPSSCPSCGAPGGLSPAGPCENPGHGGALDATHPELGPYHFEDYVYPGQEVEVWGPDRALIGPELLDICIVQAIPADDHSTMFALRPLTEVEKRARTQRILSRAHAPLIHKEPK